MSLDKLEIYNILKKINIPKVAKIKDVKAYKTYDDITLHKTKGGAYVTDILTEGGGDSLKLWLYSVEDDESTFEIEEGVIFESDMFELVDPNE